MAMNSGDGASPAGEAEAMSATAGLFRTLAEPARLVILQHLRLGEHRVVELTEHLGLAQSTVSKHLAGLKEHGLVVSRPQGRSSVYSLAHVEPLTELLASAERLLTETSDR